MTPHTSGPAPSLDRLAAFLVREIPRQAPQDDPRSGRRQALAAITSAYHAGPTSPVAMAWSRCRAGGSVEVMVGGHALACDFKGDTAQLRLPSGAVGVPLASLKAKLGRVPWWVRIDGIVDVLTAAPVDEAERRPSMEEGLLATWQAPFAWLMYAQPLLDTELEELTSQAWMKTREAMGNEISSPKMAIEAERHRARYRELSQALTMGMWKVHLLAGAAEPEHAAEVAGLVCASADTSDLPYQLVPVHADPMPVDKTIGQGEPFVASSELVAALAVAPAREVAGVRLVDRPTFDVTPETAATGLEIGAVLDGNRQPAGALTLDPDSLNRHTFVTGATGAGKSQTIRTLLTAATNAGIPWLVVEPAKAEYRKMAARLLPGYEVIAIRPGEVDVPPASIYPLEPAPGFPLQTHADLVKALFLAAFEAQEPFPQVLSAALTRCYTELGWDLALGEPINPQVTPRYPSLADLERTAEQVVNEIGYGREVADNVRGFVRVRLASLRLGTTGRFLGAGHPIDFTRLLNRNVVLEIEDVGDDMSKAFLMGTVLLRLVEHLRVNQPEQAGLKHLTVIEEAHRLLRRPTEPGPAAHAVEMFAAMLAEVRAYGEGIVISEQIPSKLIDDVIKNTAVKIVHRLPALDDRQAVGATMHMDDEQSGYLVTLPPGEAAVFSDEMDYPILTRMPLGDESRPFEVASVDPVVGAHSASCTCKDAPCTLRELTTAARPDRRLTIWAELAVLGHLTGWGLPIPGSALRGVLEAMPVRQRDSAIAHAVDQAVAVRSAAIASHLSPADIAEHVAAAMRIRAHQDSQGSVCPSEPRWEVDLPPERRLVFGIGEPSTLETAIGTRQDTPNWNARLSETLNHFWRCHWPSEYLVREPTPQNESSPEGAPTASGFDRRPHP